MPTTTPAEITPEITAFCRHISPAQTPTFVQVQAEIGAKFFECYDNVTNKVASSGGRALCGWAIWQCNNNNGPLYFDAQHHSVWSKPDGTLLDVSPHLDGATQIVFLPDPEHTYQGTRIPNRRLALTDHPLITEFLAFLEFKDQQHEKCTTDRVLLANLQNRQLSLELTLGLGD